MGVPGEWQEEVRSYARLRRAGAAGDPRTLAAGLIDLLVSQGFSADHAHDARLLIDRVAAGGDGAPDFMIDVVVAGLETVGRQAPLAALRVRHREVTMRLWTLLRHLRQSGEIVYQLPGAPPLPELERRMLLELHDRPALRLTDFTAMFGLDKAQVSRAIRGLADDGLVERLGARGAIRTSAQGAALAARLVAVARTRSARLIEGVAPAALADFEQLVTDITRRAVQLLRQEQGAEAEGEAAPGEYDQLPMSRLFSLFTYMQRGGALMIRRLADVSNFEWLVLSTVHEGGAMTPAAVVDAVARHHSQALRTLRRLVAVGLLERPLVDGRPGPLVQPSAAGRVGIARVEEEGWRRDTHLFGVIEPARLDRFVAVLDRMVENAIGETPAAIR
ncbi:MAG: MarR family transcriptional regulator [Sphingomonas fennica]